MHIWAFLDQKSQLLFFLIFFFSSFYQTDQFLPQKSFLNTKKYFLNILTQSQTNSYFILLKPIDRASSSPAESKAQLESLSLAKYACILCPNH